MNEEYKDFIGIYTDVCPAGYSQHLINEFERLVESGAGYNRQKGENAKKHNKNDYSIGLNTLGLTMDNFENKSCTTIFFDALQQCYESYTNEFSILKTADISGTAMKMQRTDPGGGYHIWHAERGNGLHADRVLVYSLYLNTLPLESGGETEFLYQKLRIKPQENTMILWPAAFTHTHRGNTVLGNSSKYIITGWFYYE